MAKNTGRGSRLAREALARRRMVCGCPPHDPVPVELCLTGEVVAHICRRCLERCDPLPRPPRGAAGVAKAR